MSGKSKNLDAMEKNLETSFAIEAENLQKSYGELRAVDGVSFDVRYGEAFGLLGPNGAGKSTMMRMIYCRTPLTAGSLRVVGLDVTKDPRAIKARVGVVPQENNFDPDLNVRDNLLVYARYFRIPRPDAEQRADELIAFAGLQDKRHARIDELSGGMKRRLMIARALLNDPTILILDEPTTGLDPQVRHEIHALIEEMRGRKTTILLTTHYIEEAERLCDRVAIIDEGRIIAMGTPRELQRRILGHARVEVATLTPMPDNWQGRETPVFSEDRLHLSVSSEKPARTVVELVKWIEGAGCELADLHIHRPTLEDVFLQLTGKSLRD